MLDIAQTAPTDPDQLQHAPTTTAVSRLDDTLAARSPRLVYQPPE